MKCCVEVVVVVVVVVCIVFIMLLKTHLSLSRFFFLSRKREPCFVYVDIDGVWLLVVGCW